MTMRLYADFALLSTSTGPSAAAYALLRQAGHNPDIQYVPARGHGARRFASAPRRPPVLVADDGSEIATLEEIRRWIAGADGLPVSSG
jgi:hypothetical protein